MDAEAAMQLLSQLLVDKELLTNHQDTIRLLQQLTFLPLAIVQAAAYINKNGIALSVYLSLLDEQEQDVIDLLGEDFEDDGRYQDVKNPVATTWLISFEQIQRLDSLAAEYLSFMSCVDPRNIPQSLLPPAQSPKKETGAIGTLDAYSFVSRQVSNQALDVHRLVHLSTRNWLRAKELLAPWAAKAVKRLEEVFPDNNYKNRSTWRQYLAHAHYVLKSKDSKEETKERKALVWKFAMCLQSDGWYNEAEKLFAEVVETRKRVLGSDHPDTLTSMANLALTYRNQGRWKEAEELGVHVIETRKRALGSEHPDTLTSIANLASTYRNQGRWKEAEELEVQVIKTSLRVLGSEHPETLTSMANLALTYRNQGRWKEAEELGVQVMETRKRVLGLEHPDTLTSMASLASTYRNQGRLKEAEELGVQVMETSLRVLGSKHPDTLTSMANLASTYRDQGRWKEAEELEVQVMETSSRVLGEEHPDTLTSMANLASTYRNQGRWMETEELGVQVTETRKRVLGSEHPDTLTSMANLALTYRNQGRLKEAEELGVQVMETRKRVLGLEHPDTLGSINNLAQTYGNQGRWKDAEELQRLVMKTAIRLLGVDHPNTLTSMTNLASTYRNQGRLKEAEELGVQVMETSLRVLGSEHLDTLTSMANLASTYRDQGRWKEAEELVVQVTETRKRVLGSEHPDTLTSMANLAHTWKAENGIPVFLYQTSVGSGTYIGQNSVGISQDDTLIGEEGRTIMSKERNAEILDDSSIASHTTTVREKLGKDYIARFLAADEEMRLLCNSVLDKIDREQFVDLGRQMLKSYYLGLLEHAKTELEKQGVRLMKSRSGRQRICEGIVDIIKSEDAENDEEKSRAAEQNQLAEKRLEMFTKNLPDTYPYPDPNQPSEIEVELPADYNNVIGSDGQDTGTGQEQDESFPDRGLESEIQSEDNDLPNLARMKEFFRESEPFQVLLNDFRIQLLPHSLTDIIQTAPRGSLSLSDQHNNSISNQIKAFVEDFTMLEWNWWPLEPRMRGLASYETRLFWHCVSSNTMKRLKLILYSPVVRGSGKRSPGTTPT
jgi:tetratricopeptide (TPR) repeat protein